MPEIRTAVLGETAPDTDTDEKRNTDEQQKAVKKCLDWFTVDKEAKQFYVTEMDENDKLRTLKHWDLIGPTGGPLRDSSQQAVHPNAIDPVTNALVEGFISEFAQAPDLIDYPMEEGDDEVAQKMTDIKQYLAYKNRMQTERLKWLGNFAWHGTGVYKHVFDPTWIGGEGPNRWVGEIRWQSSHPRYVFPDMACGEDIHQGRRIHYARYVTKEYIEDKFPEFASQVQTGALDTSLLSQDESDSLSVDAQTERVLLVETWYIGKPLYLEEGEEDQGKGLHCIWWCGETHPVFLRHANYLYYKPNVDPKFPFTFSQCYLRDGSCWGRGQAFFVKQLQVMLNKVSDVIMEAIVHQTLGQTFFKTGAFSPKQQQYIQRTGTLAGNYIEANDLDGIKRVWGAGVPGSVMAEPSRLQRSAENALGRYDISVGRSPVSGSASSFKALALLDQRAQVRLRPIEAVINAAYEDVGMYLNRLIWKNYTEHRAYRIIGRDSDTGQDVVKKRGVFQLSKLRKVHDFSTASFVVKEDGAPLREADLTPEFLAQSGWEEGKDFEVYEPELDVKVRTSTSMPSERFFWVETAKELLIAGSIDLKTFFYTLEHGRFPAWGIVKETVAQMQEQRAQAPAQGGPGTMPPGGRLTYTWQSKDPNVVNSLLSPLQGQQQGGDVPPEMQALLQSLSPEDAAALSQLPPEQLQAILSLPPEEIATVLQQGQAQEQMPTPRQWTASAGTVDAGPRGTG